MRVLAAFALVMTGFFHAPARASSEGEGLTADVTRQGDHIVVELHLNEDAPEWVFTHSPAMLEDGARWRMRDWTVLTPGLQLATLDGRDSLLSTGGGALPRTVRLRIQPRSARVEASYNPVIDFGSGSFALYTGQFAVEPRFSKAPPSPMRVSWQDRSGPILANGERRDVAVTDGEDAYITFGQERLVEHRALSTVVHGDLPDWISAMILDEAPALIDHYVARLGGGPALRPTVMAGWNGPTAGMTSMGGSVLPGLIAVSFEGGGLVEPSSDTRFMIRAFLAHESAHFWLGQTVRYNAEDDLWITEGGADLMSARAARAVDPEFPDDALIQALVDDCRTLAQQGAVSSAGRRGQPRAYYACGATFALAAEGARARRDGGDWLDVVSDLISTNRGDGVITRAEWLDHFESLAGARPREIIEILLDRGGPSSSDLIDELFELTGVDSRPTEYS